MGIKGTVRRSQDGHIIHSNVDTDIIVTEEPKYGSDRKPEELYSIIEHFALGRRRLELFGEDHNVRPGWVTVGLSLSASNFSPQVFTRSHLRQCRQCISGAAPSHQYACASAWQDAGRFCPDRRRAWKIDQVDAMNGVAYSKA